jgi:DNA-directed RNA polymerase subunit RPC12/RpoP
MDLKIAHQCPQCGGPVSLAETDRFFACDYCRVRLYITARGPFHYRLTPKTGGDALVHIPYWRFKGVSYTLRNAKVQHRILDMTRIAVPNHYLPYSLGVRPQAVPLTFVTAKTAGSFLPPATPLKDILDGIDKQLSHGEMRADMTRTVKPVENIERAYIGETASVIFLPVLSKGNRLQDGISAAMQYQTGPDTASLINAAAGAADWSPRFLPALCPACGWDLDGQRESCVFACDNCSRAWMPGKRDLTEVKLGAVIRRMESSKYIPFWKIRPRVNGVDLETYADLIRYANLPKAVIKRWESQEMVFWTPAFKVRPKLFLLLAGMLTISPPDNIARDRLRLSPAYPVTLPLSEAEESLKTVLASLVESKSHVFEKLGDVAIETKDNELIYLPFTPRGNEFIYEGQNIAVPKAALAQGKNL